MDAIKVLETSSLFSTLPKRILWRIANLGQQKTFKKGNYLIREAEAGGYCYIITSGRVEIYREIGLPNKLILNQEGPGQIIGELSLIDGLPRSASVIALEDTETLEISEWDFKAQLQAYPEIALQLLPVIARRLRQAQNQLVEVSQK